MARSETGKTRQRALQDRTTVTRGKIVAGAIQVLAHGGVQGLTHRAVAKAAGVSLAATTYHFDTMAEIIEATSRALLDDYLAGFRRLAARILAGEERSIASLVDLVERVVGNALGRDRTRSLAWCELILHGGRSPNGRALTQSWYEQLDTIWYDIALLFDPAATRRAASAAVDMTAGLTFFLHPLGLDQATAKDLLDGRVDVATLLAGISASAPAQHDDTSPDAGARYVETRQKVLQAAIDIVVQDGAAGISYGRIADAMGMVRSGPSYYFPSIDGLLQYAQMSFFGRAKARYRSGLTAQQDAAGIDTERLLDLTTAIYFREALEFARENIGFYSVWMNAAQNPALRPAVASSLLDLDRAWTRRITAATGKAPAPAIPLRMQALFIGKVVRTIAASIEVADLSRAREDFAAVLRGGQSN